MMTVGVLARFEAKPGNEAEVERFFQEGLAIVQRQKASTAWFAFRLEPATFGARYPIISAKRLVKDIVRLLRAQRAKLKSPEGTKLL